MLYLFLLLIDISFGISYAIIPYSQLELYFVCIIDCYDIVAVVFIFRCTEGVLLFLFRYANIQTPLPFSLYDFWFMCIRILLLFADKGLLLVYPWCLYV